MNEVRFNQHYGIYNSGETAGFTAAEADELVRKGVAVPVETSQPAIAAESEEAQEFDATEPRRKARK